MNRAVAAGQRGRDEGNRTPNPRLANTSSGRDPSRALGVDTTPEQARLCRGVTASTSWCPLLRAPDVPHGQRPVVVPVRVAPLALGQSLYSQLAPRTARQALRGARPRLCNSSTRTTDPLSLIRNSSHHAADLRRCRQRAEFPIRLRPRLEGVVRASHPRRSSGSSDRWNVGGNRARCRRASRSAETRLCSRRRRAWAIDFSSCLLANTPLAPFRVQSIVLKSSRTSAKTGPS